MTNKSRRRNNNRRSSKRSRRLRKRGNSSGNVAIMRSNIVDDRVITRLKYATLIQSSGSPFSEYVFTGNGLYDPDVTSTGSQPAGYDEWSLFYSRYRGLGCSISVKFINNSATIGTYVSILATPVSTGVTTVTDAICQPYCVWGRVGAETGNNVLSLRMNMSSGKIFGQNIEYDDLFAAATSANPSRLWYFIINCSTADATTNLDMEYVVVLNYRVKFWSRISLDRSTLSVTPAKHVVKQTTVTQHTNIKPLPRVQEDEDEKLSDDFELRVSCTG